MHNHIPDIELNRDAIAKFYRVYYNKSKECQQQQNIDIFGIFFRMSNQCECQQFFQFAKQENFKNTSYLIASKGFYNESIFPLQQKHLNQLAYDFEFGQLCSRNNYYPFLIQQNHFGQLYSKVVIRVHLLISSLQPFIAYFHKRYDFFQCEEALNQATPFCSKPQKDRMQKEEVYNYINSLKKNASNMMELIHHNAYILVKIIQTMTEKIKDPRIYELISIDFQYQESLGVLRLNKILRLEHLIEAVNSALNQQIIKDSQEIIQFQFNQRVNKITEQIQQAETIYNKGENQIGEQDEENIIKVNKNENIKKNISINNKFEILIDEHSELYKC